WTPGGSALSWRATYSHEGRVDSRRRLAAEIRTPLRDLAVGSSQLPWAHHQLAAIPLLVKGLLGLGIAAVCSRAVISPLIPLPPDPAQPVPDVLQPLLPPGLAASARARTTVAPPRPPGATTSSARPVPRALSWLSGMAHGHTRAYASFAPQKEEGVGGSRDR